MTPGGLTPGSPKRRLFNPNLYKSLDQFKLKNEMTEIECSYELGTCKNKIEFWVTKKNDDVRWWYPLCKEHLNLIIDTSETDLEQLQKASPRMYKRTINWEELGYHSKIHVYDKAYGDIKITIALKEYRKKKLQKYINKRKSVMGEISEDE